MSNIPTVEPPGSQAHATAAAGSVPVPPFPGPRVTGLCLVAGPVLALIGTVLGIDSYRAKGADFVAAMVAHPDGFGWAVQIALASMVLTLVAVGGLAAMITARTPGWGRTAGVVTMIGLCGPISFESVYWAASKITDTAAHRAAAATLIDQSQIIPRSVMNVTGPCLVVGFILLGIAAAKSGVLDRPRAILLGLTCLIPAGFISGHLVISAVAFACTCVALVPLGLRVLQTR
ncbi:MAG TPA: hypothetical protein VF426_04345 [Marmoricola sp.]